MLSLSNLTKRYGKQPALKGVSLTVERGETIGMLGVSGAGKTTLASLLTSRLRPTSGDVAWDGNSIYNNLLQYRAQVGFCPQRPSFHDHFSVTDTLTLSGRRYGMSQRAIRARRDELITSFGLAPNASTPAALLQREQQQCVAVAASLMHAPTLLILDEPTAGLDPHIRRLICLALKRLTHATTLILMTRYLDEVEALCDRVCMIENGLFVAVDTPYALVGSETTTYFERGCAKLIDSKEAV